MAILEATTDFVGFAAPDAQILYINRAGRTMVGIAEDEDVSKLKIPDCHPDWTNEILFSEALPTAERKGLWRGEAAFLSRDGHEVLTSMVLLAHKTPSGDVEFFSTISRDITER
ncbi:MAG: PAS domain S-box protein, partial [Terriglobia bacterium]